MFIKVLLTLGFAFHLPNYQGESYRLPTTLLSLTYTTAFTLHCSAPRITVNWKRILHVIDNALVNHSVEEPKKVFQWEVPDNVEPGQ